MTLPDVPSTPLAPFLPSETQLRFLALHSHHLVTRWTAHFQGALLRAQTDRGRSAYIWRDELAELFAAGLMEPSLGVSVRETQAGRDAVTRKEIVRDLEQMKRDAT